MFCFIFFEIAGWYPNLASKEMPLIGYSIWQTIVNFDDAVSFKLKNGLDGIYLLFKVCFREIAKFI
jgi:hypothetical protein